MRKSDRHMVLGIASLAVIELAAIGHSAELAAIKRRLDFNGADLQTIDLKAIAANLGVDAVLADTGRQSRRYRQLPARLVISAAAQQAPTSGPIPSSLRAARRAGFTRANSATISCGSPNSATADSAARSGASPCWR
jgi:hypothetical protein